MHISSEAYDFSVFVGLGFKTVPSIPLLTRNYSEGKIRLSINHWPLPIPFGFVEVKVVKIRTVQMHQL